MALKILNKTQPELGVVANTYNPSTWEVEEGGSEVQGQHWLTHNIGSLRSAGFYRHH